MMFKNDDPLTARPKPYVPPLTAASIAARAKSARLDGLCSPRASPPPRPAISRQRPSSDAHQRRHLEREPIRSPPRTARETSRFSERWWWEQSDRCPSQDARLDALARAIAEERLAAARASSRGHALPELTLTTPPTADVAGKLPRPPPASRRASLVCRAEAAGPLDGLGDPLASSAPPAEAAAALDAEAASAEEPADELMGAQGRSWEITGDHGSSWEPPEEPHAAPLAAAAKLPLRRSDAFKARDCSGIALRLLLIPSQAFSALHLAIDKGYGLEVMQRAEAWDRRHKTAVSAARNAWKAMYPSRGSCPDPQRRDEQLLAAIASVRIGIGIASDSS